MSKVRIGFIGVGTMGQMAHLKNYVTLNDCEVVALAEVRPKARPTRRAAIRRREGVPRSQGDAGGGNRQAVPPERQRPQRRIHLELTGWGTCRRNWRL